MRAMMASAIDASSSARTSSCISAGSSLMVAVIYRSESEVFIGDCSSRARRLIGQCSKRAGQSLPLLIQGPCQSEPSLRGLIELSWSRFFCVPVTREVPLFFQTPQQWIQRISFGFETRCFELLQQAVAIARRLQQLQTGQHDSAAPQFLKMGFERLNHAAHYTVQGTLLSRTQYDFCQYITLANAMLHVSLGR